MLYVSHFKGDDAEKRARAEVDKRSY